MTAKSIHKSRAIELRKEGRSLGEISEELKVSKTSVSVWCSTSGVFPTESQMKDIKTRLDAHLLQLTSKRILGIQKKYRILREAARSQGRREAVGDPSHVSGCMLYWAEGEKKVNKMSICNTDPILIKVFLKFLRAFYPIESQKILVECIVHDDSNNSTHEECRLFWSGICGVPSKSIKVRSPSVQKKNSQRKNKHRNGICIIRINNYLLVQRIYGSIEAYAGEDLPLGRS